jgi:hypothetical protein
MAEWRSFGALGLGAASVSAGSGILPVTGLALPAGSTSCPLLEALILVDWARQSLGTEVVGATVTRHSFGTQVVGTTPA